MKKTVLSISLLLSSSTIILAEESADHQTVAAQATVKSPVSTIAESAEESAAESTDATVKSQQVTPTVELSPVTMPETITVETRDQAVTVVAFVIVGDNQENNQAEVAQTTENAESAEDHRA